MTVISFQDRAARLLPARAPALRDQRTSTDRPFAQNSAIEPPPSPRREAPVTYRPAVFLAHLVAIKNQAPQTRDLRRAEPTEAIRVYRAAMMQAPASLTGGQVSRTA